jgi:hypothetical protein
MQAYIDTTISSSADQMALPDAMVCYYDRMVSDESLLQNDWLRPQLKVDGLNYSTSVFDPEQESGDVKYLCRQYPVYVAASKQEDSRIFPPIVETQDRFKSLFCGKGSNKLFFTKFLQPYVKLQVGYVLLKDRKTVVLRVALSTPAIVDGKVVSPSPRPMVYKDIEWDPDFEPVIEMKHSWMKGHSITLHQGREVFQKKRMISSRAYLNSFPEPRFVQVGWQDVVFRNTQPVIKRTCRRVQAQQPGARPRMVAHSRSNSSASSSSSSSSS